MVKLSDFDALIFDCDGVLVDSEVIYIAAERALLAEIGLAYSREAYLSRFVGLSNPDYLATLKADFAKALPGKPFPSDYGERLHASVWPQIEAELKPLGGVADVVREFEGRVAVASSSPLDRLRRKLTLTGLIPLFEPYIYSADHVEHGKPAPDLFLHAAEQLLVEPARCAVIEDSVNGIQAASAAGMFAIGFTGGGHADDGLADRLLASGARCVLSSHLELIDGFGSR